MSGAVVVNRVRHGFYLDSVALMRIARQLEERDGVRAAALMIATPANLALLADAELLGEEGRAATARDLIIAVHADTRSALHQALQAAEALLQQPLSGGAGGSEWRPRMLRSAVQELPGANLALVSVAGEYAAAEARRALRAGLHVLLFSDNVPLAEEVALKQQARAAGLLLMGPDCGTALIGGVPLAFANAVPRGEVGIVSASGTGLQEVSVLIARMGGGVSHGIGTGGRDLSGEVGGIATLMAIDALDGDSSTAHIVLLSKPPAPEVARAVLRRVAESDKPFTVCFLGQPAPLLPPNARAAATLQQAAELALGRSLPPWPLPEVAPGRPGRLRGLFVGGTFCAEAQLILCRHGRPVGSNVPVPGADARSLDDPGADVLVDLGADEFTRGRPHPMLDPKPRNALLEKTLRDPAAAVVLLDVVLGHGVHEDPARELARTVADAGANRPHVVASLCGTEDDPQDWHGQLETLRGSGILLAPSNAAATELALRLAQGEPPP